MSWANSVLPVFMAASRQIPGRLPEQAIAVQIDTTIYSLETPVSHGFQRFAPSFNRTAVVYDSVSNAYKTYTDAYSGYSLDLTKKIGESQNVDVTTTDDAANSSVDHRVYIFDGVETLTIAGVMLNTCRLTVTSSSPDLNGYGTRHGTYKMTEWVSAGYGLDDYEPIKGVATITFLDGYQPSSVTESSVLTSPLK